MVMLQSGVFENLLRMHLNPSEEWRKSVIVWGAFLGAGIGELLHCEKLFNALEYWRILQNGLLQMKRQPKAA